MSSGAGVELKALKKFHRSYGKKLIQECLLEIEDARCKDTCFEYMEYDEDHHEYFPTYASPYPTYRGTFSELTANSIISHRFLEAINEAKKDL